MQAFQYITSQLIPLDRKDVDTDMIIPATFLTSTSQGGYGENLFRRLRDSEPDFPFNQERFQKAQILIARDNFGCGSSREHAVWALLEYGIRVVIAPSFADIFFSNSAKNGLVTVILQEAIVDRMIREAGEQEQYEVMVDLEGQVIKIPKMLKIPGSRSQIPKEEEGEYTFPYDPFRKECILKGYDDFDYLMGRMGEIEGWQGKRDKELWYRTTVVNNRSQ